LVGGAAAVAFVIDFCCWNWLSALFFLLLFCLLVFCSSAHVCTEQSSPLAEELRLIEFSSASLVLPDPLDVAHHVGALVRASREVRWLVGWLIGWFVDWLVG